MLVEIARPRRAAAQRVDLWARQAIKVVELHRRQRRAQFDQFRRRLVELAALVVRADDEHPHVRALRRLNGRPVQIVHEIPVDVDVIEFAALDRIQDDVGRGVGGKSDEPRAALRLELCARRPGSRLS